MKPKTLQAVPEPSPCPDGGGGAGRLTHIKAGMSRRSWPTGAWRRWERACEMSAGGPEWKKHPKQMKQLDVGSPQTQLSTRTGEITSHPAPRHKTHVGGVGGGLWSWRWGTLPVHLPTSHAWACRSWGRGGTKKVSRKKSPNAGGRTADSGVRAGKCLLLLTEPSLAQPGRLPTAFSAALKRRLWAPKGSEGRFQRSFSVCMCVFPLLTDQI